MDNKKLINLTKELLEAYEIIAALSLFSPRESGAGAHYTNATHKIAYLKFQLSELERKSARSKKKEEVVK